MLETYLHKKNHTTEIVGKIKSAFKKMILYPILQKCKHKILMQAYNYN